MKNNRKKLSVSRETVRRLRDEAVAAAHGGAKLITQTIGAERCCGGTGAPGCLTYGCSGVISCGGVCCINSTRT
jgi:hypothetical protein